MATHTYIHGSCLQRRSWIHFESRVSTHSGCPTEELWTSKNQISCWIYSIWLHNLTFSSAREARNICVSTHFAAIHSLLSGAAATHAPIYLLLPGAFAFLCWLHD